MPLEYSTLENALSHQWESWVGTVPLGSEVAIRARAVI